MADGPQFEPDVKVRTNSLKIGCIGAGMIMAECHLAAYKEAGFPVAAIASRTKANAEKVAKRWGIPKVHATPEDLIRDETIEINSFILLYSANHPTTTSITKERNG